ncbi:MAG: 2OG-Fe(II) oxygenase [Steroidobacterales bacterium]
MTVLAARSAAASLTERIAQLSWPQLAAELDASGTARVPALLSALECAALAGCYANAALFRSRIVMAQHGFGRGEYQYFAYPLPALVAQLRAALYPPLATIANRWHEALQLEARFPPQHGDFLERCHRAGQTRPTPLLLRYATGDYNCLHQDLYGEHVFPLQLTLLLSSPRTDFRGGEFVVTEQRPRAQSRVEVVTLERGDAVVFASRYRPGQGARSAHRLTMRHGVSPVHAGERYTLGIVFHDAL